MALTLLVTGSLALMPLHVPRSVAPTMKLSPRDEFLSALDEYERTMESGSKSSRRQVVGSWLVGALLGTGLTKMIQDSDSVPKPSAPSKACSRS